MKLEELLNDDKLLETSKRIVILKRDVDNKLVEYIVPRKYNGGQYKFTVSKAIEQWKIGSQLIKKYVDGLNILKSEIERALTNPTIPVAKNIEVEKETKLEILNETKI